MVDVPFIAIEGPIGVGKTSLAKELSTHFGFHLLQEIVEENPFLSKFYKDIDEWSFQTEMFFLCNRFKQLEDIKKNYLNKQLPVVADYHISKNMIFAKRTLHRDQLVKYKKIYHILTEDMPLPNLLIYLDASLDTLLKRIERRGREIELNIKPTYLSQLSLDYKKYMDSFEKTYPNIPVIRVNGDELDFIRSKKDLETIIHKVEPHIKRAKQKSNS